MARKAKTNEDVSKHESVSKQVNKVSETAVQETTKEIEEVEHQVEETVSEPETETHQEITTTEEVIPETEKEEEVIKENKPLLNKEQRSIVYKYIMTGYQVKDILRKSRAYFSLSDEIYGKLSHNVKTVEDLINNIGVPYISELK